MIKALRDEPLPLFAEERSRDSQTCDPPQFGQAEPRPASHQNNVEAASRLLEGKVSNQTFAIIALTLTNSAYVAEIYRAGIESIHPSQTAAARSLGLTHMQAMRFVIVPQAVRRIIPPLLNSFISLQKDTALVNIIGATDAFNQAKIIASNHFNLSTVTTVAIIFVLITIPQARLVDRLVERRRQSGGM